MHACLIQVTCLTEVATVTSFIACLKHPSHWDRHVKRNSADQIRARGYKTFFMLNSIEHKILIAHTYENI